MPSPPVFPLAVAAPRMKYRFIFRPWKVLLEGLSTSNTHSLWPIRIDIFAVLMKNGCLTKLTFL